jgi:crotonobetainyl-CoA:carnitine CoA-transferase CaiB-like acyl-CoA transferase
MKTALGHIKVVDLSRILAGPWASQMLADMGAQVIKIENPKAGDDTRRWGPPFVQFNNQAKQAAYFHCANRNKQSLAVDISQTQGQKIVKELITNADVVIENFKVGGLAKYGLDYQSVKALNPQVVYCSITGFGQQGPYAHKAGYDAMIQGEGGLMSLTGNIDGEPMKVGVALVDVMTGLYSCNAILAALMAKQHLGEGQYIDIALLDVQLAALANQGMNYLVTGENPQRQGNAHPNIVPYQTFASQDGNLILAIGNDKQFEKFALLCEQHSLASQTLLTESDLQAEQFKTNEQRVYNRKLLIPLVANIIAKQPTAWWIAQLEQIQVPCGPVNTLAQVFEHPQVKYRQMVRELPDYQGNHVKTIASPINLSKTPLCYQSAAPALGQHSESLLKKELNYSDEQVAQLISCGIVKKS